jgi:CBS domain-containing membrane protein
MLGGQKPVSLRARWLSLRARCSVPALIAADDERSAVSLVAAVNGGMAVLIISLCAWVTDVPLLFPALGPTAFILFSGPFSPAAAPRSVILGHLVAMASGLAAWHLVNLVSGGSLSLDAGGWLTCVSASLALAMTCLLLVRLSVPHAPACASALIIAVGAVIDWLGVLAMVIGVVMMTLQAVGVNRCAGLNTPLWSPRREDLAQS